MTQTKEKDNWDKAEIAGKAIGAILIPLVIGVATISLNSQSSKRGTAAQMASIAVSILSEKPEEDAPGTDALREWALTVLENPGDVVPLSKAAANDLRSRSLNWPILSEFGVAPFNFDGGKLYPDSLGTPPIIREPFRPTDDGGMMLQEPYRPSEENPYQEGIPDTESR